MVRIHFKFDKELVCVKVGEVASADVTYYSTSKGSVYNPQPTPGTVLRTEGGPISYFKLLDVWTSRIIKNSLVITEQRMKDLAPSSNTASFTLAREPLYDSEGRRTLTGAIVANQSSATVEIYDDNTLLYTGRLSSSHSWNLADVGNTDLQINLHDITTTYLKQTYTDVGVHYMSFKGTLGELMNEAAGRAGLQWDDSIDLEDFDQPVIAKIPSGSTCEEVLRQALVEHGYVYYSLPNGKLSIQEVVLDPNSEVDYTIWASSKDARYEEGDPLLYVKNGSAVSQTTSLNRYKSAEVNYAQLDHSTGIRLYENGRDGAKLTISAHNWYDGLASREREIGSLPTIEAAEKETGALGRTNKFALAVPAGSDWDAICIKFKVWGTGLFGGGNWGRDTYIAQKVTTTTVNTFYDEDGEEYTEEETIETYPRVSNMVSVGDDYEGEKIYKLTVPCTTPNLYFVNEKHGWGFFANMHTKVLSDAVRWISTMTSSGVEGEMEFQDLDAGRPLWYVGTVTKADTPSTYDSRIKIETNPANRVASTWTPFLIDNTDNGSPISMNVKFLGEVWRALSTDEYSAYESSDVEGFVDELGTVAQVYKAQASYTHEQNEVRSYAKRLADYFGYCDTKYVFYSKDDIELGSIVNIKDNMYSNLNAKVFVYGKTTEYREGSAYRYMAFAIDKIGYTQSRTPLGRPAVVDNRGPAGPAGEQGPRGLDGLSTIFAGDLSWTQAQVNAHPIGNSDTYYPIIEEDLKVGDVFWYNLTNTTNSRKANLLLKATRIGPIFTPINLYLDSSGEIMSSNTDEDPDWADFRIAANCARVEWHVATNVKEAYFLGWYTLETVILDRALNIGSEAFYDCRNLNSVTIKTDSVCQLAASASSIFGSSPAFQSGGGGKIIVPDSLVEAYKADSKWSSLASHIVGGAEPTGIVGEVISYLWDGEQGPQGPAGESEKGVRLESSISMFKLNKRTTTTTATSTITGHIIGLDGTMTLTTDVGTISPTAIGDGGTATLTIPITTSATQVHVTGIKGAYEYNLYIPIEDITEYNVYSGPLTTDPTNPLFGDFYFNTSTNKIRAYDTAWHDLSTTYWSNANISRMCAVAQKDVLSRIPAGSVASSDYGYFNSIIAGTVTANYIKSQTGVFDNITVTNANVVNANVSGDFVGNKVYIKALRGVSLTPQTRYFKGGWLDGNYPCVTMAEWRAAFPFDGCYLITSGKIGGNSVTAANITFGQWEDNPEGTIFGTIGKYKYQFGAYFCSNEGNTLVYMPEGAFENLVGPSTISVPALMPSIDLEDQDDYGNQIMKPIGFIGSQYRPWLQIWGESVHGAVFN